MHSTAHCTSGCHNILHIGDNLGSIFHLVKVLTSGQMSGHSEAESCKLQKAGPGCGDLSGDCKSSIQTAATIPSILQHSHFESKQEDLTVTLYRSRKF